MSLIWIAEDDDLFASALIALLESAGHTVRRFRRGDDLWGRLEDLDKTGERPPDLLILDWEMPGLDGIHVCRWMRMSSVTMKIPVMFLTGRGNEEDKMNALRAGADQFLTKLVTPGELILAHVKSLLRRTPHT